MGLALGFQLGVARFRAIVAGGADSVPVCVDIPVITGEPVAGATLQTSQGAWDGSPTPTFTYAWERSGAIINGETGPTYVVSVLDEGHFIQSLVTAANRAGSDTVSSARFNIPLPEVP